MIPPDELRDRYAALEPDAQTVVSGLVSRLEAGRLLYGNLDVSRDRRCFRRELLEELLDAIVYGSAELIRQEGE